MQEAERQQPHKVDENMWKNREQIEEILFLLEAPHWPGSVRYKIYLAGWHFKLFIFYLVEIRFLP